jgi:predicted DNA-binding protein (MmcQ/YjbR family)
MVLMIAATAYRTDEGLFWNRTKARVRRAGWFVLVMASCSPSAPPCATTLVEMVRRLAYDRGVAHPQMFDDDDGFLERIRELAATFPNSGEKVSHGRPAFFTKKVFAYYGGSLKVDGEWIEHGQSIVVQPDPGDRRALLEDDRVYVPAYLGPSGWIGIDLDGDTDWSEIGELLDASYRLTAPARDVAELDARR